MTTPDVQPRRERPRFRETALASGLVDVPQLAIAEAGLAGNPTADKADPAAWDQALADRLVQEKILTPFQAREILAGRRRFRLGQYTVLDEVARGGMGQVFRAEHAMMGREVAVKVLPRAKATPESEAAFRREMRMLGRLDHENLVRAFDAGYDAMVYYLVTELVPGLDLKRQVLKHGPLDEPLAASVIAQAARGLAYAHEQGLVHRDVKPGNLLVTPDGRVKVLDLGLAGSQIEEESSRFGRVVGTMDYIAPEQIRSPDDVGPTADIYALGCTLYYAVTGQVPFPGGTRREKMQRHLSAAPVPVRELAPRLSPEFARVIEAMMAKNPADRITSAAEVVERLRPWTPAVPIAISGPGDPRREPPAAPPPLPGDQPSISWLTKWSRQEAAPPRRSDDEVPWLVPEAPRLESVAWARSWRGPIRRPTGVEFLVRAVPKTLPLAAVLAAMFGGTMSLIQRIDPERFDELLFGIGPFGLGCGAFLMLVSLQVMVLLRDGQRR